jgi:hypothetical protein
MLATVDGVTIQAEAVADTGSSANSTDDPDDAASNHIRVRQRCGPDACRGT